MNFINTLIHRILLLTETIESTWLTLDGRPLDVYLAQDFFNISVPDFLVLFQNSRVNPL